MITWLKRIGFIASIIIMLEVVAWIGIALFGDDWFQKLKTSYIPKSPTPVVSTDNKGIVEKCSTFDGKLFCIKEKK